MVDGAATSGWTDILHGFHVFLTFAAPQLFTYFMLCYCIGVFRRIRLVRSEPPRPREPTALPLGELLDDDGDGDKDGGGNGGGGSGDMPAPRPAISIITSVKWATTKSADPVGNFRSQVLHEYAGRIENIYVFESDRDPGLKVIEKMQQEHEGRHAIRIVIAGLARTCSQKMHNMLAGVDAADPRSEYVFFLDNSTRCLRTTLSRLVERLEASDHCLGASGYPLDVAPSLTAWPAWIMANFRYILMGFVFMKLDASYGWGGAMLLRKSSLSKEKDPYEIRKIFLDGGVQDDMTLNSIAIENGLYLGNVPHAVYFNTLRQGITYATAWDFLRRQIVLPASYHTLGTYLRHQAMLWAWTLLNALMCAWQVCTIAVGLAYLGVFRWHYIELYPSTWTMLLINLATPLLNAVGQYIFLRGAGRLFNFISKEDPTGLKFPMERVQLFPLIPTMILTNWFGMLCGFHTACTLGSIDWAGIRYTMKGGKCIRVTHLSESTAAKEH